MRAVAHSYTLKRWLLSSLGRRSRQELKEKRCRGGQHQEEEEEEGRWPRRWDEKCFPRSQGEPLSLSLSASSGLIRFLKRFRGEWYLDRLIGSIKRLHLGTRDFSPPPLDRFGEMASMERDRNLSRAAASPFEDGLLIYRGEREGRLLLEYRIARGEPVRLTISAVDIDICNCCVTVALRIRESQVFPLFPRFQPERGRECDFVSDLVLRANRLEFIIRGERP